jgi:hypothetical protein
MAPKSKAQIGTWDEKTWLRQHWGIPASAFTRHAFWRAMDAVDADALAAIKDAAAAVVVQRFGVWVQIAAYDATNCSTDIAPRPRARWPSGAPPWRATCPIPPVFTPFTPTTRQ